MAQRGGAGAEAASRWPPVALRVRHSARSAQCVAPPPLFSPVYRNAQAQKDNAQELVVDQVDHVRLEQAVALATEVDQGALQQYRHLLGKAVGVQLEHFGRGPLGLGVGGLDEALVQRSAPL